MSTAYQETGGGRKPRSYYVDYTKGNNRFRDRRRDNKGTDNSRYKSTPELSYGNRGFLITSVDEVKSYLEMRNIFEDYFDKLYSRRAKDEDLEQPNKKETMEDELESELKQLRIARPFKQLKTFSRNSVFLNIMKGFEYLDPVLITERFFDDLAEKRELRSSNTFKVLPILDTFRNSPACAKESISTILTSDIFKDENSPMNYFIELQSRGNYKLLPEDKQKMIETVAATVTEVKPNWKVDRENADYMIVLVALKNVCCLSIVKDYFKRCKYNVIEFCKDFVPSIQTDEDKKALVEEDGSSGDSIGEVGLKNQPQTSVE